MLPHDVIDAADKAVNGSGVILGIADFNAISEHVALAILAEQQRVLSVVGKYVDPITAADIAVELRRAAPALPPL